MVFDNVPISVRSSVAIPVFSVAILAFVLGFALGQRRVLAVATQSQDAANIAHGVADATKQQAIAADAAIESQAPKLAAFRATVARKTRALRERENAPITPSDPDTPVAPVDPMPVDRLKDEVIETQKIYITGLEATNATLVISRDAWKATSQARDVENLNLRAAIAAKDGLIRGALWRGRIQGLAIGIAVGYAGGKIR